MLSSVELEGRVRNAILEVFPKYDTNNVGGLTV